MILKKIKLENIRSYESQEISFPEGSTVLSGDIGCGKTSVLLAIEFALFGLQPGQKGASLLRNGKDQGCVALEIEIEGKKIIFERGLKRGKTVNQDYAKIITEDSEKEVSVTELKNKVLELLNYPKEFAKKTNLLYRFTVYTPQEEMKQIILEQPESRLDTLRHIFGIDKYKLIKENTTLFAIKLREQIRNYEGQILGLEDLKKKIEEKYADLINLDSTINILKNEFIEKARERQNAELLIKEVEEKIKEKEKYEQEIEKSQIMLIGKRDIISNLDKDRIELQKQIEDIQKQLSISIDIKKLEENSLSLKEEINKIKLEQSKTEENLKEIESKIKEKEKYEQEIEKSQIMLQNKNEFIINISKEKELVSQKIEEIKKLNFRPEELVKIDEEIKVSEQMYEQKNREYLDLSGKISSFSSQIINLNNSNDQLSSLHNCPTCFQHVPEEYKLNVKRKFEDDILKCKKEILIYNSEKDKLSKEIDSHKQNTILLRKKAEDLKILKFKFEDALGKESKIKELEKQKNLAEKDVELLDMQIKTLKVSVSMLKKYDSIFEQKKIESQDLNSKERKKEQELIAVQRALERQADQKEKIKEKEYQIQLLEKKTSQAQKDISLLETQIESLKEAYSLMKKYDSIYELRRSELEDAKRKEREKEIELTSKQKEKEFTLLRIAEIKREVEVKEKVKQKLLDISALEYWLSNFFLELISFTERNIMLKLREEFSKLFNEWFNILVPEIFAVRLDEDFTPIIEQQDFTLDYSFLSGGERTAIALAYRLALNQVLNSLLSKIKTREIVILDEPTDGFSEQQLDKMRDVLQQLKVKQLVIVSHESKIESFVENIIKFKKEAGITKVEA